MFTLKLFLLLCFIALVNCQCSGNCPQTRCSCGPVRGSYMYTRTNRTIFAFRGIRYALAPEGPRRFRCAEPVRSWAGVYDATVEGPACPCHENIGASSEDCLRVNVYTTCLPGMGCSQNRPVIVFFHPGAFDSFSAQSNVFGPQYLLDQDVVLVTVGYRLGALGFIATGDARAPGNLGLKDQVVALRWVRDNIAGFCGNSNSVTITGYSTGSWSVILHMLSPMSAGLFHRAIAMSGAPTTPELLPREQRSLCRRQARYVGCPSNSVDAAFDCLRTTPCQDLCNSRPRFNEWYSNPTMIWSPVVEPEIPGVERFLTAQPVDLIRQGRFHHVPLIIGTCRDEYAGLVLPALEQSMGGDNSCFDNYTANWEYAAPICFQYQRNTQRSTFVSTELRSFYFNNEPICARNGRNLGLIYADSLVGWPTYRCANLFAQYSRAPVYNYQFTYQGRNSFAVWSNNQQPYGVTHHDDLQYIFHMEYKFPLYTNNCPEARMCNTWTGIWGNFAQTGCPNRGPNRCFEGGVTWTPLEVGRQNYLEIGNRCTMRAGMNSQRYALWNQLFPLRPVGY